MLPQSVSSAMSSWKDSVGVPIWRRHCSISGMFFDCNAAGSWHGYYPNGWKRQESRAHDQ